MGAGLQSELGRLEAITVDGDVIAHCAFYTEIHRRIILAAPELFDACEEVIKAFVEKERLLAELEEAIANCSDRLAAANISTTPIPNSPLVAAVETALAVCMKVRGETYSR